MTLNKLSLSIALAGLLTGCVLEDEDKIYSHAEVAQAVKCSNQAEGGLCDNPMPGMTVWEQATPAGESEYYCNFIYCLDDGTIPETPKLTRYREGDLIPVYFRDQEDPRFTKAMDYMEDLVGYELFDRRGVISGLDLSDYLYVDHSNLPTDWGLILSQGTAPGSLSGHCSQGTVSIGPYNFASSAMIVSPEDFSMKYPSMAGGVSHKFQWVNIDSVAGANNGEITCNATASQDVTIHELAHALGMRHHFAGFGNGDAWGKNAERVLKTMYRNNQPGTPFETLIVE